MAHFDIVPDVHGQTAKLDALLLGLGYLIEAPNALGLDCSAGIGDDALVACAWQPGARGLAVEAIVGRHGLAAPPAAAGLRKARLG